MTIAEKKWTALPVLHAIEVVDRIPKERYLDPEFFAAEVELLWPRVWQMACRLEEIPNVGDFAEYEILDQSVIVLRTEDGVRAFQNACRHRGVQVVKGRGSRRGGFVCPFHGWCYGTDGRNTRVTMPSWVRRAQPPPGGPRPDAGALRTLGRLCLDQPGRRGTAAPLLHRAVRHGARCLEGGVDARRVVVRLPPADELEAGRGGLRRAVPRVAVTPPAAHPRPLPQPGRPIRPARFVESELHYLRIMSEGMAGMVHARDVLIAEELAADLELPADYAQARAHLGSLPERGGLTAEHCAGM